LRAGRRRSPPCSGRRQTTRARNARIFAAHCVAQSFEPRACGLGRTPFDRTVKRDHALAERRQFGAAVEIASWMSDRNRRIEHRVQLCQQLPRALVRHLQHPRRARERALPADLFQQRHLARSEPTRTKIDADRQSRRRAHHQLGM